MIVYTSTKQDFCEAVRANRIDYEIHDGLRRRLKRSTSESEVRSWKNSMQYMFHVVDDKRIPDDVGIAIEYSIPQTSKRIDFIVSGFGEDGGYSAVVIELKQWEEVYVTEKDAVVETFVGRGVREQLHPSYQAWSYTQLLNDFNEYVYENQPALLPCAYLHNCRDGTAIRSERYHHHLHRAPVFLRDDFEVLVDFVAANVRKGDRGKLLYEIENGRIRPSKDLADHMVSLLDGNKEFLMIDDQKIAYETAIKMAEAATIDQKKVLIIEGGPGTGKSVVAVNLLVDLLAKKLNTQYLSTNQAPRDVYERRLSGSMRKSRISNLFKGTAGFVGAELGAFDCLVVDESHRLVNKTRFNNGENQVKEIIHAANCSIFFIDESQRVTMKDIGSKELIRQFASEVNAEIEELELASQFRCNGSDGYLAFLDNTLGIRETANPTLDGVDYDFRVCDSPQEVYQAILEKNRGKNKSRMVAGYCWPWKSQKDPTKMDIVFLDHGFQMQWNLQDSGSPWLIDENSVEQIGCIHTCQGLELEYVGVILGLDFVIRDGEPRCSFAERAKNDSSWKGFKSLLKTDPEAALAKQDEIVKNTYRVLMSRGQKGCYVWSVDPETNLWLKELSSSYSRPNDFINHEGPS